MPRHFLLQKNNTIVAIGDSITEAGGYLRDSDAALADLYPALQLPRIINTGISGQKAEDLVNRFQRDVVDRKPTVVTLSIGINDVWHRLGAPHDENVLKAYRENVAKMVDMAQTNGIKVILLTPTLIQEDPAAEGNKRLAQYVDVMKGIARDKKCGLADLHAMFLEALKHKPAGAKDTWLTTDGVHMSPLGNAVMAAGVLRALGVPDRNLARLK
jgi:lysophospholipase L1-like esterase